MADHARSRESHALPKTVWRVWSDTKTWQQWNPNVQRMEMSGPFESGTTGVMHTPTGKHHPIQLANVQPDKSFDLQTQPIPLTRFTFHCEVVSSARGSRVTQSVRMSGPLAFIIAPLAGDRIAQSFEPLLKGLSDKAEAIDADSSVSPSR